MSHKHKIEDIRNYAEKKNIKLLSTEYVNRNSRLKFLCPIHGEFYTSCNHIFSSHICKKCGYGIGSKTQALSIQYVKNKIAEAGYIPLFTEYSNAKNKLLIKCPIHGNFYMNFDNFNQGKRCNKCKIDNVKKKLKTKFEDIEEYVIKRGYSLLTTKEEYSKIKGIKSKIKIGCNIHGEFICSFDAFKYGNGCTKCSIHNSDGQEELYNFVSSFYPKANKDQKNIINPYELDIYIKELNLAIEYNGLYWHSEKFKNKNYHLNKMKKCNEKGIRLITIFEDEWINKKDQVKNFILSVLHQNNRTIFARNCQVKNIDSKTLNTFLESYHIQGKTQAKISLGIFHKNELIGVMSGNIHHRNKNSDSFVLNRLAFKSEVSIIGGASKLFKCFMDIVKTNGYKSIISWSDNRWSEGNVYKKMGFVVEEELGPDYSYIKNQQRMSKQSCQKKNLLKKGAIGNTEKEMAKFIGLHRIWDCGKKRWRFNI